MTRHRRQSIIPAGQVLVTLCFSAFLFGTAAHSQRPGFLFETSRHTIPDKHRTNGDEHLEALAAATDRERTGRGAYALFAGSERVALATLVDKNGYFLTKSSALPPQGDLAISLGGASRSAVVMVKTFRNTDLALLRAVNPNQTWSDPPAKSDGPASERGQWLLSTRPGGRVALGVVGSPARAVKSAGPAIGVSLDERVDAGGVRVMEVFKNSAADSAGIRRGDLITRLNGDPVASRVGLIDRVRTFYPGETIEVALIRDGQKKHLPLVLGDRSVFDDTFERITDVSGRLSRRKTGFASVVQHDTPLEWKEMGGPAFDLDGRWIGINVARVNRLATYLLPTKAFLAEVEKAISADAGKRQR